MKALQLIVFLLCISSYISSLQGQDWADNLGVLDIEGEYKYGLEPAIGKLFFIKDSTLWATDGTLEGTMSLEIPLLSFESLGEIDGRWIFFDGYNILSTDGTPEGNTVLQDSSYTYFSFISFADPPFLNEKLHYFARDKTTLQYWLCATDGTSEGTEFLLAPVLEGVHISSNSIPYLFSYGDAMYFLGDNPLLDYPDQAAPNELWRTDGTSEGTYLVKDFSELSDSLDVYAFIVEAGEHLFIDVTIFESPDVLSPQLWTTDGTTEGTVFIANETMPEFDVATVDDNVIFSSFDYTLLNLNLTSNSVTELFGDSLSCHVSNITPFREGVIFAGWEFFVETGPEPWISDLTPEGTVKLKDIIPDGGSGPHCFQELEDYIVFHTYNEFSQEQLWLSDGTEEGTTLLVDYSNIFASPSCLIPFKNRLFFMAENNQLGRRLHYFDWISVPDISGKVFHDLNENGIWEEEEPGITGFPISATNNASIYTYSNQEGDFSVSLEDSTNYNVSYVDQSHCWVLTSQPGYYDLTIGDSLTTDLNFGFRKLQGAETAYVDVQSGPTRCGFTVPFWVNIYNTGCEPVNGQVTIELDENVTLSDYDEENVSVDGQVLLWNFADLEVSHSYQLELKLIMPGTDFIGEDISLITTAYIMNDNGALDLAEIYNYTSTITCAYDPNDKQTVPSRPEESNSNYTLIDEYIQYTIRFQNTGNDTAFTVRLHDQLSPDLDWETLEPLSASHAYRTTLFPDGKLEFLFEDILLPDSIVNEPASHGYVTFRIKAREDIEDFSTVENTAYIYFDYNSPIITNTVINTLVASLDIDEDGWFFWEDCNDEDAGINPDAEEIFNNDIDENCDGEIGIVSTADINEAPYRLFPNPAKSAVYLETFSGTPFQLEVKDAVGRQVMTLGATLNNRQVLNVASWAPGVYFFQLKDKVSGEVYVERMIIYSNTNP
jgi:uncharacterized repeat protein (TIGR01451 family)